MAYITNTKKIVEGSSISINDNEKLIDLELKGNTTQDGTPTPSSPVNIETVTGRQEINVVGKNLLNTNLMIEFTPTQVTWHSLDGVTGFYNVTNIAKSNIYYDIKANKTYTFSVHQYNNINTSSNAPIQLVRGDNASVVCSLTASSSFEPVSFTPTEDLRVYPRISVGSANVETQCIVQLEAGSTATTYEPYIGKQYEINLGKNLFKPISFSRRSNGIDYVYNLDGSISCNGTATGSSYSMLSTDGSNYMFQINAGTYTISGALADVRLQVIKYDNGSVSSLVSTTSSTSFTVNSPTNVYIRVQILNGTTVDNVKVYPQLEKGSQATSYSLYKEPVELCKIGDYQDYIRKSTGKNLYSSELELGTINTSTGQNSSSTYSCRSKDYISVEPNTTYTISNNNDYKEIIYYYNETKAFISVNAMSTGNQTFTTPNNCYYIRNRTSEGNRQNDLSTKFQLEKGNQATSYEPYGINWYIHKEIGKAVLDGGETNWSIDGTGTANYFYKRGFVPLMKTGGVSALSSHYEYKQVYTSNTNQGFYISATETNSQLRIRYGAEDTVANFKTWLSNNNVSVYYVLATPTDTIIENTELINQLNTIELYKNINNINVSSANLSGILKLDYYSTDNPYQDVIYSQEDVNKCKLYFNDIELEDADEYLEKITFIKRVLPENGKKVFGLDNFIAEEVEIIIHDIDLSTIKDKVRIELGTLVNNDYVYVPMGVYNIQDTPTRNDNKITIKLRDNACLFDFNYNAKPLIDSLGGTATKMQILQDICSQANVNCNVNSFTGDSDLIGTYDNSIKGRMYVAHLAEQSGNIATIDRNGNLIFVPLNNLYTHRIPLSIVSKYVKGTPFKIERIVYELGTIKFETSSDNTLQTLYISSENPFISVQNDIDRIFPMLENFELDSVEIQKEIIGNPAIDGYDLIEIYDDEDENEPVLFKTLANNTLTYNGKFKSKYKVEIGLEERTENVSKNSNETFKKTVKNEIDLVNGKITQTVEEVSTLDDIINGTPTYVITTDTTFQADKPYYKLVDNDYVELVEGTDYNDGDTIASVGYDVYDIVYENSIMDTVNNNISNQINSAMQIVQRTLLEQTSEKFTMWFEQTGVQQLLDDTNSLATANSSDIEIMKAYIDYGTVPIGEPYAGSPYILLGKENSQTKLRILDNRIQFLSSGQETAYISNNTLYINESTVLTKQIIGNNNGKWITEVDSQGNLNTYWGG